MERRYGALQVVAGIFRGLAYLAFVGAIVVVIFGVVAATRDTTQGIMTALFGLLYGGLGGLTLLAYAELIQLLLGLEDHTHAMRETLNELAQVLRERGGP